jgi:hypothetical protein
MKVWMKNVWHDPVWSNAIGTVIGTAVVGLLGYSWSLSGFSMNPKAVWAGAATTFTSASGWLATPVGVPKMVFCIFAIALIVNTLLVHWLNTRRARPQQKVEVGSAISNLPNAKAAAVQMPKVVATRVPPATELGSEALRFLGVLIANYPKSLTLEAIVAMSALTYPVVEWNADNLADMQLVELVFGAARRPIGAVLTKRGRDYCINSGIDLV